MWKIQEHNGQKYITNVRTTTQLCKNNNIQPVLLTFLCNEDKLDVAQFEHYQNELFRQLSREEDIPLIDLEKNFVPIPNKAEYFFDDGYHPNIKGVRFIADAIAAEMRGLLSLTERAR